MKRTRQPPRTVWRSECRQYRVVRYWQWVANRGYAKRYYALVKAYRFDGKTWLDFAADRRPYKSKEDAIKACARNQSQWKTMLLCSGKREAKALYESDIVFQGLPVWVNKLNNPLVSYLQDHTRISESSSENDTSSTEDVTTPALAVRVEEDTKIQKTETPMKATSSRRGTSAKRAKAPAKARGNRSTKNTKTKSTAGKRQSKRHSK